MPNQKILKKCSLAALIAGLAFSATPAHAGFQWVAPNDGAAYQAPAPRPSYKSPGGPEIISPVVITGSSPVDQDPVVTIPSAPTVDLSAPMDIKPAAPKAPAAVNLATEKISVSAPAASDVVQGFATQIPLALALRQIMPVGYNFSIDQDVGMDTLVSYKGGKNWRDTIKDMLSAVNLQGREQGTSLIVSHSASAFAEPEPAPALQPKQSLQPAYVAPSVRLDTPSYNVGNVDGWSAQRGDTLRKVLTDWCRRSSVELQWLAEYDYPLEASAHFSGGFEDAVRGLLAGFDGARPQPIGALHTNTSAGQMVLVVQVRGNNYSN